MRDKWDGFDLLRNGIDLLTTRTRREKRRACGEKAM